MKLSPPSYYKTIRPFSSRAVKTPLDRASGSSFCCICCFFSHGHSQAPNISRITSNAISEDTTWRIAIRAAAALESIWSFFVRLTYLYAFIASSELFSGNPMWRLSGYITHTRLFWIVLGHVACLGRFCSFWLLSMGLFNEQLRSSHDKLRKLEPFILSFSV